MKTKISHLGRSTVSVILAVMMLLSTMLIGTVSTVNATVNDAIKVYFDKSVMIMVITLLVNGVILRLMHFMVKHQ